MRDEANRDEANQDEAIRDEALCRREMVRDQIASPPDDRQAIADERVLAAMRAVPRHLFAGKANHDLAYADMPLDIGWGQTISQPYMVALMTEAAQIRADARVLEIGTGCGYQTAVLLELTPLVFSIEIVEGLGRAAGDRLDRLGYSGFEVHIADGHRGWPAGAPYDAILVTSAATEVPAALLDQLAPGGRLIIPIGAPGAVQELKVIEKLASGSLRESLVTHCRFVPMTGSDD